MFLLDKRSSCGRPYCTRVTWRFSEDFLKVLCVLHFEAARTEHPVQSAPCMPRMSFVFHSPLSLRRSSGPSLSISFSRAIHQSSLPPSFLPSISRPESVRPHRDKPCVKKCPTRCAFLLFTYTVHHLQPLHFLHFSIQSHVKSSSPLIPVGWRGMILVVIVGGICGSGPREPRRLT